MATNTVVLPGAAWALKKAASGTPLGGMHLVSGRDPIPPAQPGSFLSLPTLSSNLPTLSSRCSSGDPASNLSLPVDPAGPSCTGARDNCQVHPRPAPILGNLQLSPVVPPGHAIEQAVLTADILLEGLRQRFRMLSTNRFAFSRSVCVYHYFILILS